MKSFKLPALLASLLLVSGMTMAQTPGKVESEAGPAMQKPDPSKPANTRGDVKAEVKADVANKTMPKESEAGPNGGKTKATATNTTRGEVKADAKQPGMTKETEGGPIPAAKASDMAATKERRAQRKAAAKAKRDAKMKAMEKPAA